MSDSISVETYPHLTRKTIAMSKFKIKSISAYTIDGKELKTSGDHKLSFDSEKSDWSMAREGLVLNADLVIQNPKILFDDRCGVAGAGTVLGIAAVVKSPASCRRRTFDTTIEFDLNTFSVDSQLSVQLSPDEFRGTAILDVVLYVKHGGINSKYAVERGFILGVFQTFILSLDGSSSIFPIDVVFPTPSHAPSITIKRP